MFYVVTRKEYTFENLGGITSNRRQRLEYRRRGLDLDKCGIFRGRQHAAVSVGSSLSRKG